VGIERLSHPKGVCMFIGVSLLGLILLIVLLVILL
jgi:hypothetical protein